MAGTPLCQAVDVVSACIIDAGGKWRNEELFEDEVDGTILRGETRTSHLYGVSLLRWSNTNNAPTNALHFSII